MSNHTGPAGPDYADLLNHELPTDMRLAAHFWLEFDFVPIPVVRNTKTTAVKWEPWTAHLTHTAIDKHWTLYPDHDVGCLVDARYFVIDADSPAAVAALYEKEKALGIYPNLIVKTTKGEHHYFRRKPGTYARMDSYSTALHPERLDVRTGRTLIEGRSMIIVPPSKGKRVILFEAHDAGELIEIDQSFIDAIAIHNGRKPPRPPAPKTDTVIPFTHPDTAKIHKLLACIDSHCGRQDWFNVLAALHHTFGGSDEGLAIADAWSSTAANYCGPEALAYQWRSLDGFGRTPITIATLIKMAKDRGCDTAALMGVEDFSPTTYTVIDHEADVPIELVRYSISGQSAEFEAKMLADVFVLGEIALLGQYTIIFAKYNTGKTLLALWLVIEAIKVGRIRAECLFYVNADDSHAGLTEKLKLAEEFGFHMLAPGYNGFTASKLIETLMRLCDQDRAHGVIVIIDTLKKMCAMTEKHLVAAFGEVMRRLVLKGGTVIALGHTNKKPGPDGRPIPEGPADLISDADCSYIVDTVGIDGNIRTIQFTNEKSRGRVTRKAAYSYSIDENASYLERLASVKPVDALEAAALREPELQSDLAFSDALVAAIQSAIREGVVTKMKLADKASHGSGESKRKALQAIEHFTGRLWAFTRAERGANRFHLIDGTAEGGSKATKSNTGGA
jgi:hypothetical protein